MYEMTEGRRAQIRMQLNKAVRLRVSLAETVTAYRVEDGDDVHLFLWVDSATDFARDAGLEPSAIGVTQATRAEIYANARRYE